MLEDLPDELRASLGRILANTPAGWRAALWTRNPDGSYTVRLCDEAGQDAGAVILWPAGDRNP